MIEQYDEEVMRCPKMGDFVPFQYCRGAGEPFCSNLVRCWATRVDIGQFIADHYSPEQIQRALTITPGGRIKKMVELAEKFGGKNSSDPG